LGRGLEPGPVALAVVSSDEMLDYERVVIARAKELGHQLINATAGGQGVLGQKFSAESRAKMSDSQKRRFKRDGYVLRPKTKREKWPDEVKAKMSAARKRHWADPAKRALLIAKNSRHGMSERTKRTLAEARQSEIYRERYLRGIANRKSRGPQTEATKAKIAAAAKLRWARSRIGEAPQ
jgi:hypothetical protein